MYKDNPDAFTERQDRRSTKIFHENLDVVEAVRAEREMERSRLNLEGQELIDFNNETQDKIRDMNAEYKEHLEQEEITTKNVKALMELPKDELEKYKEEADSGSRRSYSPPQSNPDSEANYNSRAQSETDVKPETDSPSKSESKGKKRALDSDSDDEYAGPSRKKIKRDS
jgi:hypothetical protein